MAEQVKKVPRRRIILSLLSIILVIYISYIFTSEHKVGNEILSRDPSEYKADIDENETRIIDHHQVSVNKTLPGTKLAILCGNVDTKDRSKMTSIQHSKIAVKSVNNIGVVIVSITAYDMLKRSSTRGDDVIVIWAIEKNGDGLVSGDIVDHKNGTYTGFVKLFWTGPTEIKARLASSIVNTCLRINAIRNYGNVVFAMQQGWGIRGTFKNKRANQLTPCGANPTIYGYQEICNFTRLNGNMSWYCGKPKSSNLGCSDIFSFGTGKFDTRWATQQEKIQKPGHGLFQSNLSVVTSSAASHGSNILCKNRPAERSWTDIRPSGYWRNGVWHMTGCKSNALKEFKGYRNCLAGKTIVIIGDSTLRQYADFILKEIMGIDKNFGKQDVGVKSKYHNFKSKFSKNGINLRYLKHEMPFHSPALTSSGIQSVSQLFDMIASENISDLIVVANYNSHFTAYPSSVYRNRQKELKEAFKRLNSANPSAKLFVKKPHLVIDDTRWFDPHIQLLNIDILKEEFMEIRDKVVLLDSWIISVTHGITSLHPEGNALQSLMQQFLSYIC